MAPGISTLPQTSRIPARFAIPVTVADGTTHLVADDVYTVTMVMLGHRPYITLCDVTASHGSPTTRATGDCQRCAQTAADRQLRRARS